MWWILATMVAIAAACSSPAKQSQQPVRTSGPPGAGLPRDLYANPPPLPGLREVDVLWWCGNDPTATCYQTSAECLEHAKGCTPRNFVSCFSVTLRLTGTHEPFCFRTMAACDGFRQASYGSQEVTNIDAQCEGARASQAAIARHEQSNRLRVEGDVPVIFVDHRFYCFAASGSIRLCAADMARCSIYRDKLAEADATCSPENGVACFRTRDVTTGKVDAVCFSLMEHCRTGRTVLATADTLVLDECFVMRYRP